MFTTSVKPIQCIGYKNIQHQMLQSINTTVMICGVVLQGLVKSIH